MKLEILHDIKRHCFSTTVEGYLCVLDYRLADAVMTITHTGVPQEIEGRGIAAALTAAAMDAARAAGWRIVPACAYAAAFMGRHPEYEDLRFRH